jgi:hypothetical protein
LLTCRACCLPFSQFKKAGNCSLHLFESFSHFPQMSLTIFKYVQTKWKCIRRYDCPPLSHQTSKAWPALRIQRTAWSHGFVFASTVL